MIQIRFVKYNDPAFSELVEQLNRELWERNPGRQSEYVSLNLLDPEATTLVAFENDIPVACGAFKKSDEKTVEIKRMFVKPDYRGIGISKLILNALEKRAKNEGFLNSILETGKNHPEAISLYQKSGYKIIENYGPYKNMPNSICMGKKL